jgi:hypothetical protein
MTGGIGCVSAPRFSPVRSVGSKRSETRKLGVCGAFTRRELLLTAPAAGMLCPTHPAEASEAANAFDFTVQQYKKDVAMSKYAGDVLVIVNVASE